MKFDFAPGQIVTSSYKLPGHKNERKSRDFLNLKSTFNGKANLTRNKSDKV